MLQQQLVNLGQLRVDLGTVLNKDRRGLSGEMWASRGAILAYCIVVLDALAEGKDVPKGNSTALVDSIKRRLEQHAIQL